jgi:DNA-binding transcriptional MerR regulator
LIASARSLGFNLTDIGEFLAVRDEGRPCKRVLDTFDQRIADLDRHIADLLDLRDTLKRIRQEGEALSPDKRCDDECLCSLTNINQKEKN